MSNVTTNNLFFVCQYCAMISTDMEDADYTKLYASQLAVQMRKGTLAYCMLAVCEQQPLYTNDIVQKLYGLRITAVEGTIYALLRRLQGDKMLSYSWHESNQGPPRKYYQTTDLGKRVKAAMDADVSNLTFAINELKKGSI